MKKFKAAFDGMITALKDKSIRIQCFLGMITFLVGWIFHLDSSQWIRVLLCVALVVSAEIFNTCIERLCDFVQPEYDLKIKKIKDMSAAAVLVLSMMALIIALGIGYEILS